jgi:hypothetical protein
VFKKWAFFELKLIASIQRFTPAWDGKNKKVHEMTIRISEKK